MKQPILNLARCLWAHRNRVLMALAVGVLAILSWAVCADQACSRAASNRIFRSTELIPVREVGLVLGTSKATHHGNPNLHFNQRIAAAAALYRAGKVRHLLVSGDNHVASYNEPADMRDALMAAGVPAQAITCDYAGFRTLDSMVRAREIFGLTNCVIISEEFHCPRALWIARQHHLDAIAFAAPDVGLKSWSWRAAVRERFARSWCAVDLYVLHRGPKILGRKEPLLGAATSSVSTDSIFSGQGA
ncbi:MAG TPA: ElyC/SanA/YdcF family protein [Verrucomicrobiae bacterium]